MFSTSVGRICVLLLFLTTREAEAGAAQEEMNSALVTVKVSDTSGSAVSNARVHFIERSSKREKKQTTDGTGKAAVQLQPGSFDLTVTSPSPNLLSLFVRDIEVKPGEHRQLDIVLKVKGQDCCIDPADPPPIEPESAKLGDVAESTQPVSFCQLVSKPELYNGKEVFVQATYNGGNEWSVLDSPDCSSDKKLVWLEPSNDKVREVIKLGPKRESVRFDLRVRGIFVSGGNYGDRGRYSHKIVASEVSKVEKLPGNK